jgi:hypothetical protein
MAFGYSLIPIFQYVYDTCGQHRLALGVIDIGAFEYNGGGLALGCPVNPVAPSR